jgi:hypothetical protein
VGDVFLGDKQNWLSNVKNQITFVKKNGICNDTHTGKTEFNTTTSKLRVCFGDYGWRHITN